MKNNNKRQYPKVNGTKKNPCLISNTDWIPNKDISTVYFWEAYATMPNEKANTEVEKLQYFIDIAIQMKIARRQKAKDYQSGSAGNFACLSLSF